MFWSWSVAVGNIPNVLNSILTILVRANNEISSFNNHKKCSLKYMISKFSILYVLISATYVLGIIFWTIFAVFWTLCKKQICKSKRASTSKRQINRLNLKGLKKGYYVDINPRQRHPGWKTAEIIQIGTHSGQAKVI